MLLIYSETADEHIDSLLEKYGIEIFSDSSSVSALDSEVEEEGELIEINTKIEEMRRVCSVATLLQEKLLIVQRLSDYATFIGIKNSI